MRCTLPTKDSDIKTYQKSSELPDMWDKFLPEHHFLKSEQLRLTEHAMLPDISFRYLLIMDKGHPVAAVYFQLLQLKPQHINAQKVKTWQFTAWNAYASLMQPKMLVAGHLFRHDIASFYYTPELTPFEAYQYYQYAITTALNETCVNTLLVKDMADELVTYFQNYAPQYISLRNDISMEMEVSKEWQSMQDYEKALKHKYAQRYRKVRNALSGIVVKEMSASEVEQEKLNIYKLYNNVTEQQQVRIGLLNETFIPILKQHYQNDFKVWGMYKDGVMIGFLSAWLKDDTFDMFYIGFDYEKNNTFQLYFNILFLSIEKAIEFNKSKLILGRTALEAKARLGCKPNYLSTYLYIRNKYIRNRVLQTQQKNFVNEGAWEERHPFKNN